MDTKAYMKEMEKKFDDMVKIDKKSKKVGLLVGRYITEPFADGRAYYVVSELKRKNCTLQHVDIYDGWTLPFVESLDRVVPKKYVTQNISQREALEKLFGKEGL